MDVTVIQKGSITNILPNEPWISATVDHQRLTANVGTWPQFIELPNNELTEMLGLQPMNIEEIWIDQQAIAERIEDHREEANQGNNQAEVAEPAEEIEHTLDQEEDFADLLAEASYILD